ncbi:MAG: sialate O-acetylesterase [Marinoscillum sp.]|uniref:sialate O-acetylesterase n=1 Tax=Marinoscillum sp. TaxID=2024838 RepID=UPI003302CD81
MSKILKAILLPTLLLLSLCGMGQLRLPRLVSDGMVLQRNTELKVWGWDTPGQHVSIAFREVTYLTKASPQGSWEIKLPSFGAGGPYQMVISGSEEIVLEDILIGDVWICSGQSNMELTMQRASPIYTQEIATAENPEIRQFNVSTRYDFKNPQHDFDEGEWVKATPETVLSFSAVAYFFGRSLYEKYQVPVGLINTSLGGSPAEAWMSEKALMEFPKHFDELQRFKDDDLIDDIQKSDNERIGAWYNTLQEEDMGYANTPWSTPDLNTDTWPSMRIPGYWADQPIGNVNGVVWFRKEISLPPSTKGKPAKLLMGRIIDADSVFINGSFVGTTSYRYPPRRYDVPAGVLRAGKNILTVRVINSSDKGGFVPDKPYTLSIGNQTFDLTGDWKYQLGAEMEPLGPPTFIRWKPGGLYNGMLAPLFHYSIKGAIWYQGESNASRAKEYRTLFPAMIRDWRTQWNQGDFPFLFVQLANYMEARETPTASDWAMLREAQLQALSVPNTAMAVITDIGEWNDIHPLNKKDVGNRLALAASKLAYGDDLVYSGPLYKGFQKKGNKIILTFNHTGSGLKVSGAALEGFAIAGKDQQFVWAQAKIKGDQITVWSEQVKDPVAVRYAWADNPDQANLYNQEGLPASPFRTDQWEE